MGPIWPARAGSTACLAGREREFDIAPPLVSVRTRVPLAAADDKA
jgi:hypothetical protein